ncbi:MAG: four helix bundle protein [Actinomycetota bacterium]|nr:four helix bundle protein [Actinomycetota bacterium]
MHDFKRLIVWQRAFDLSVALIPLVGRFTGPARYALGDQITRAAISIASNVAEGSGRSSERELRRFLAIALGSAYELETQMMLARDLGMLPKEAANRHLRDVSEIQRMIHGFRKSIRT